LFERPRGGDVAVLVHITIGRNSEAGDAEEFRELALSAGAEVVSYIRGSRSTPDPKYFVGRGKLEEIKADVSEYGADVVIFDHELSPGQERNLERELGCRVLDRTGLILDIFAQRARSFEGKLQVELAQLKHLSTRLIRGWTHLERQKGGIGLRGPGETQLETDRRLIGARIKHINKKLERVRKQRDQGRRARDRAEVPTVSLVGYTNAGKSTLFNRMTGADVFAQDQLFATLDPTIRRVEIGDAGPIVFADTVGFVRSLPHDLVAAFRSTLEETRLADLLLHIVDASDPELDERIKQVNSVLAEIGADERPQILVYNKIDLLPQEQSARIDFDETGNVIAVWLSAKTGEGMEQLSDALKAHFSEEIQHCWVHLGPEYGNIRAQLYRAEAVISEEVLDDGGFLLEIRLQRKSLGKFVPENVPVYTENPLKGNRMLAGAG
jgi:GTP-binding protein HflX